MNGAVQGEATTTASTPERKWPDEPPAIESRNSKSAREIEREEQEEDREHRDGDRRLELEAPAELLPERAQADEQPGEEPERDEHARDVQPGIPQPRMPLREPEHLDRQHRQHARHQVEQQSARERKRERHRQSEISEARTDGLVHDERVCRFRNQNS